MKKKQLLFITVAITAIFFTKETYAKIWRVNNQSNYDGSALWGDNFGGTPAYPVFKQINQAVAFSIVNDGDTIHVEGSTVLYEAAMITKRLVIIGPGYFLTGNPKTSENVLESRIGRISLNAGSSNSQVIGLDIVSGGNVADRYVYVSVSSITIKRCRIEGGINFGFPLTDIYILENFFPNASGSNVFATDGNVNFVPPTNLIFNNNICQNTLVWGTPLNNPTIFWPVLQCNNNVFDWA